MFLPTGKTLAFGLPSLTRLVDFLEEKGVRNGGRMQRGRPVSMIVLCPTRELARQVSEELSQVAKPLGLFVDVFHGGVSYDPQVCLGNQYDSRDSLNIKSHELCFLSSSGKGTPSRAGRPRGYSRPSN